MQLDVGLDKRRQKGQRLSMHDSDRPLLAVAAAAAGSTPWATHGELEWTCLVHLAGLHRTKLDALVSPSSHDD